MCHVLALALLLAALPLAAQAQQATKAARIGYLSPASAAADASHKEAFRQGLRALGYVEGQNVLIETRYADGRLKGFRISPRSSFVSTST